MIAYKSTIAINIKPKWKVKNADDNFPRKHTQKTQWEAAKRVCICVNALATAQIVCAHIKYR